MGDANNYGRNDYMYDFIENYVDNAKYFGSYEKYPERFKLIKNARNFDEPMDLEDWINYARYYPSGILVVDKVSKFENEDVPVRSYFLIKAICKLLNLVDAPPQMASDIGLLLSHFSPRSATKYGEAQRAMIENPRASITRIAELSGLDRSTIHVLLRKGALVRPDQA